MSAPTRRRNQAAAVASGIALLAAAPGLSAGELSFTPTVHLEGQFDSNAALATTQAQDAGGGFFQTSAEIAAQAQRGKAVLKPQATLYRYNQDDNLDRFEGGGDFESTYAVTDRFNAALDAHWFRQYTITTEAEDTGATTDKRWRHQLDVTPHFAMDWSATQHSVATFDYLRTRYEDGKEIIPFNYEQKRGTLRHEVAWSEASKVYAEGYWSEFTADVFDYTGRTAALVVGDAVQFANGTTIDLNAGAARSRLEFDVLDGELSGDPAATDFRRRKTDVIGALEIGRKFPTSTAAIGYERMLVPSSRGALSLADRYVAHGKVQFSERLDGTIEVFYQERESRSTGGGDEPRNNFGELTAQLSYAVTPMWAFGGGYRYRTRENPDASGPTADGKSDCVFMFVNMVGTKFASPF